jgi:HlyD family secretion protein
MNKPMFFALLTGAGLAGLYYVGVLPGQKPAPVPLATAANNGGKSGAIDTTAPAVSVAAVTTADFVETVLITGSVVARDEVLITPEIEGFRVIELMAEEGDSVTKGQLLAKLSSDTLEAQVAQNDASLTRADASIAVARSAITQAETSMKEADNAFDRTKSLKQSGYASTAAFEQREAAALNARAKLASSRDSLKSAEADKALLEAQRSDLVWRRSKSEIRSPVDGQISRRTARVGAVASSASEPMFRIIARGDIELDAEIAEGDIGKIREGQVARVTVTGMTEVPGTVRLISSEVDRSTRLGKVRIALAANKSLRPGGFGRGTITTASSRGLAVPTSAVVYVNGNASVQVVKESRVSTRAIGSGLKTQQFIEVRTGLAEGDLVVAKAGSFLRDGDQVRPITAELAKSGATQ